MPSAPRPPPRTAISNAWRYRFEDEMLPMFFPFAATALLCGLGYLANLLLHKG